MTNIDQLKPVVKSKVTITIKPKVVTVSQVFADFEHLLPSEVSSQAYDGSARVLSTITKAVAAERAKEAAQASSPTASYVTKKQKEFAAKWWSYLTEEIVGGPEPDNGPLKKALALDVKQTFDAIFHKLVTGHDLPEAKDGFERNAMKVLRRATGHGDAAIFLFRLRYWWPKAQIVKDGKKWIAKTHKQWAEELGMEERGFRTAYNHLLTSGMIEARQLPFNGQTMNHVRPAEATEKLFCRLEKGSTD